MEADTAVISARPLCRECKPFMQKLADFNYGFIHGGPFERLDEDVSVRILLIIGLLMIVLVTVMVIALQWAD
jgi:hypothetical protein